MGYHHKRGGLVKQPATMRCAVCGHIFTRGEAFQLASVPRGGLELVCHSKFALECALKAAEKNACGDITNAEALARYRGRLRVCGAGFKP